MRFIGSVLISIVLATAASAQPAGKKIWDGVFTAGQALRGKSAFDVNCSRCHNIALIGSERGPEIKGSAFLSHWEKDTLVVDSADEVHEESKGRGLDVADYVDAANTLAVFLWGPDRIKLEYVEHKPGFSLV